MKCVVRHEKILVFMGDLRVGNEKEVEDSEAFTKYRYIF